MLFLVYSSRLKLETLLWVGAGSCLHPTITNTLVIFDNHFGILFLSLRWLCIKRFPHRFCHSVMIRAIQPTQKFQLLWTSKRWEWDLGLLLLMLWEFSGKLLIFSLETPSSFHPYIISQRKACHLLSGQVPYYIISFFWF